MNKIKHHTDHQPAPDEYRASRYRWCCAAVPPIGKESGDLVSDDLHLAEHEVSSRFKADETRSGNAPGGAQARLMRCKLVVSRVDDDGWDADGLQVVAVDIRVGDERVEVDALGTDGNRLSMNSVTYRVSSRLMTNPPGLTHRCLSRSRTQDRSPSLRASTGEIVFRALQRRSRQSARRRFPSPQSTRDAACQ